MLRIAHRGNIVGPNKDRENEMKYVSRVFNEYDAEVDIRYINGVYYLGHDYPKQKTNIDFLLNPKVWCHAKDGTTLRQALKDGLHCFYDSNPNMNYTLTSKDYIWHWDGTLIYVMDENGLIGMCSDYVAYLHG